MRIYLYVLAGITSALIGWNLGQFFLTDLSVFRNLPEIILFPCITISLAVGMVLNEIFLSSPTRPKLNLRVSLKSIIIATGLGLSMGLFVGLFVQLLFLPQFRIPAFFVRIFGWLCIGSSIGLAEGYTWRWRSIEAGDKKRFRQRFKTSIIASNLASLTAAIFFEIVRLFTGQLPRELAGIEDPIGFSILGALLGLAFSLTSSPSYMIALRAGKGFEYTGEDPNQSSHYPCIQGSLKFVSNSETDHIEEGLSIQLPVSGKITIGSDPDASLSIPELPPYIAYIELKSRESRLVVEPGGIVEVNGEQLKADKPKSLKHNSILTFYSKKQNISNGKFVYRFVYYNRFLDPQA
jgi:hypothetical protein